MHDKELQALRKEFGVMGADRGNVHTKKWRDSDKSDKIKERIAKEKNDNIKNVIKKELKIPNKNQVSIPARSIDVSDYLFDDNHIKSRNRNISKEEAVHYVEDALFSILVWDGKYERFFSKDGATYVNLENKIIRTAFRREDFTENLQRVMKEFGDGEN